MSDLSGDELAAAMMAEAAGGGGGGGKPAKSKLMPTIAAVGILTIVAIGGGAGVGMLLGKGSAPPAAAPVETAAEPAGPVSAAATESESLKKSGKPGPVLMALSPIITNIASPPKTMLRIEASILIQPDGEAPTQAASDALAAEIQADTVVFLRSVDIAQIEGSRGLLHLREDLLERARIRSPTVRDYLIKSLVVQ